MPKIMTQLNASAFGSNHRTLSAILQIMLVAIACATPPETLSDKSDTGGRGNYVEKRAWQSLQGPWGKRWHDAPKQINDEVFAPAESAPLFQIGDPDALYSVLYLTNAELQRLMNQHRREAELDNFDVAVDDNDNLLQHSSEVAHDDILQEKRTWKNMNAAWGKRRNDPAWNKFRGAWGKREQANWNNLKGMWGKRASRDWQKLHAGWGKRDAAPMN